MRRLQALAVYKALLLACWSGTVHSQGADTAYPSRPVVMISGFAAGGPVDYEARLYAMKMSGFLGQSFVLDFKPGVGGRIGNAYVAKARPDGHTLLLASGSFTVYPAFYNDLPFDTVRDFAPISIMSQRTSVLVAHPAFPAKNLAEFMAHSKTNPGKVNYGTSGAGGISHLAGAWLDAAANIRVTFVHYKGTGPLMLDLTAGRLGVGAGTLASTLPLIISGKVRALAILNDKRSKLFASIPTVAEQGIPDYNYVNWMGIASPGATPVAIVNKLSEGFARVARESDLIATLEPDGILLVGSTPEQMRQLVASEIERWKKIVRDGGITIAE